jgi:ATP-dependent Clp protease ATP-binding subunit ClpC
MHDRFTEGALRVLTLAKEEAMRLNHEYIGTTHILFALIIDEAGLAAKVFKNNNVDLVKMLEVLETIAVPGAVVETMGNLCQTPRAQSVVERSTEEARKLDHSHVGPEHILLSLISDEESVAAQILMAQGIPLEDIRAEVLRHIDATAAPADKSKLDPEDPYAKLEDLPPSVAEHLRAIDKEMGRVLQEKESAFAARDFDRAACLGDKLAQLKKEWFRTICQ